MITHLTLRNFKCFRALELPLSPLTLLAGLNGMGKSTVIQALLLLRQSLRQSLTLKYLHLSGDLADLGTGADALYDAAEADEIWIGVEGDEATRGRLLRWLYAFDYDRNAETLRRRSSIKALGLPTPVVRGPDDADWRAKNPGEYFGSAPRSLLAKSGFQYLSAERLGPRKVLPLSEDRSRSRDLGKQGEFVLQYLVRHGDQGVAPNDPRAAEVKAKRTILDQTVAWLQETSPGTRLEIRKVTPADVALARYSFERKGDVPTISFRPTNVGFGLSYVLPVIVALMGARRRELVLIENPEAHLHPRGQTRLGQLAARTAAAGVQVIVETHSDHFMDGVRIDVRRGRLRADAVSFHYFERYGSDTRVISPELDGNGRLSEWPTGFFDQRDENLLQLV